MHRYLNLFLALFILAITLVVPALHAQSDGVSVSGAPVVTVITAMSENVETRIAVSGTLVAAEEVLINTRINGYAIENIAVEIGDTVEAGSVLATLDKSSPAAQLAQAEAELVRASAAIEQSKSQIDSATATMKETDATLKRNEKLRQSANISEAILDQARAAATSARANLASSQDGLKVANAQHTSVESQRNLARLTLARTQITAPVAGIISARNAQLGEIASGGGEPMFRLIRNGQLEIAVEVVETALGGLDKGDATSLNVAGVGLVTGTVRLISPIVDPRTRLGTVRLSLPTIPALKAGLSASGWIITDRHEAITVPASAVLTQGLESYVQLVVDGVVRTRSVMPGVLTASGSWEILKGLDGGETVIARAGAFFIDGDAVRPVEAVDNANTSMGVSK